MIDMEASIVGKPGDERTPGEPNNIYIYIYTHYKYVCMYVCMYIYIYIHTYIHTYVHTYVHTYIHTYIYGQVDRRGSEASERVFFSYRSFIYL